MPRVSEAHKSAQRRRVLEAARRSFTRNGFHLTSMDDLVAASGMSAGAIYRYFPNKEAIIAAIASDAIGRISGELSALARVEGEDDLRAALVELLSAIDGLVEQGVAALAIQVWGEAQRNPALAEIARSEFTQLRSELADLVARTRPALLAQSRALETRATADGAAQALFSLLPGYLLQRAIMGPLDPSEVVDSLGALFAEALPAS